MHLNTDELVDIAEGTQSEATAPHLAGCEPCRAQLRELRAMMMAAKDVDVPEPSPLFWDHLSARIREGVAIEPQVRRVWWRPGLIAALGCAAAILVAVGISIRERPDPRVVPQIAKSEPAVPASPATIVEQPADAPATDAAWALLRDAASDIQFDDATEAGLNVRPGAVDSAVFDLTPAERDALGRLLQDAIRSRGGSGKTL